MIGDILTLGSLKIECYGEKNFESYTVSKKKSVGKLLSFHVTDEEINLLLGYADFINGERDIRTQEVSKDFTKYGRLIHGLRLAIQPVPENPRLCYAELRQAIPKDPFDKHETLHPTISESDLDDGAGLSVFESLRQTGADVGTKAELLGETGKRSPYLCVRFPKDNIWAPVVAYTATRILPMKFGYRG